MNQLNLRTTKRQEQIAIGKGKQKPALRFKLQSERSPYLQICHVAKIKPGELLWESVRHGKIRRMYYYCKKARIWNDGYRAVVGKLSYYQKYGLQFLNTRLETEHGTLNWLPTLGKNMKALGHAAGLFQAHYAKHIFIPVQANAFQEINNENHEMPGQQHADPIEHASNMKPGIQNLMAIMGLDPECAIAMPIELFESIPNTRFKQKNQISAGSESSAELFAEVLQLPQPEKAAGQLYAALNIRTRTQEQWQQLKAGIIPIISVPDTIAAVDFTPAGQVAIPSATRAFELPFVPCFANLVAVPAIADDDGFAFAAQSAMQTETRGRTPATAQNTKHETAPSYAAGAGFARGVYIPPSIRRKARAKIVTSAEAVPE